VKQTVIAALAFVALAVSVTDIGFQLAKPKETIRSWDKMPKKGMALHFRR